MRQHRGQRLAMRLMQLTRDWVTGCVHEPEQWARRKRATRKMRCDLHLCPCFEVAAVDYHLGQPLTSQTNRMQRQSIGVGV